MEHVPVLREEVIHLLSPREGETVIDATLGLGGHAKAFLGKIGPKGRLIGLDADEENLREAERRIIDFFAGRPSRRPAPLCHAEEVRRSGPSRSTIQGCGAPQGDTAICLIHGNFRDIASLHLPPADILFADLGLSSPHIDDPQRGFTFRLDAPLDLRFDRSQGETAGELLARLPQRDIAILLRTFGELKDVRRLAERIVETKPSRTSELVSLAEEVFSYRAPRLLPRIFQALRIAVNDELRSLQALLLSSVEQLSEGGRIGIISYHSLEDRMVKRFFRDLTTPAKDPVTGRDLSSPPWELLTKKAVTPSEQEIAENPRSRSAKFRVIRMKGDKRHKRHKGDKGAPHFS